MASLIGFRPGGALVETYLSTFTSPASARSMRASLDAVAREVAYAEDLEIGADPLFPPRERLDWVNLDYQAAVHLRSLLVGRWSPATVNRHLAAVRGVVRTARLSGLMEPSRADAVSTALTSLPRSSTGPVAGPSVTHGGLKAMFADIADRDGDVHRRDAAMLALLTMCAVRRSELAAADVDDLAGSELVVRHGKGGRQRLVFLHGGALHAVEHWRLVRFDGPGPLLVTFGRGCASDRMTGHGIWKRVTFLADRAGVPRFAPHDCRRWAITELLSAGQDVIAVRDLAGHASVDTTSRYDRRGVEAARQASTHLHIPYVPPHTSEA